MINWSVFIILIEVSVPNQSITFSQIRRHPDFGLSVRMRPMSPMTALILLSFVMTPCRDQYNVRPPIAIDSMISMLCIASRNSISGSWTICRSAIQIDPINSVIPMFLMVPTISIFDSRIILALYVHGFYNIQSLCRVSKLPYILNLVQDMLPRINVTWQKPDYQGQLTEDR